jgi:hypothetical protein
VVRATSACVLDIIYGLVTKKIAVGNLRKIIVTPKEDNLFLYIIIYGVTIIFLKFPTGGGAFKKIPPSGGRRENFGGISCEKSRFYGKKLYFFPILGPPPWIRPCVCVLDSIYGLATKKITVGNLRKIIVTLRLSNS